MEASAAATPADAVAEAAGWLCPAVQALLTFKVDVAAAAQLAALPEHLRIKAV